MAAVLAQTAARPVQAPCKRRTAVRVAAMQQGACRVAMTACAAQHWLGRSGSSGAGFEAFRPAVLPLAVVAIAGAGAAAVKADPEFAKLVDESWGAKNSNAIGAGYETAPGLKDTPFFGGSNTSGAKPARAAAPKKAGTTKTGTTKKAASTGTAKKSVLGSVFGSRG
ncbi:hypothetical protein COHA_008445 [Chlorella ohadii]|uniref:Uncharacterized protein n=1 Tax=Chlorella ohadii TaxID=2649997 RepID=A0AAD5H1K0_9CHLO|nr:hypothetical protein COHA_008445 [Chlorella ohadii]